jgi:anti-sigma factor RsiW
MSGCQFDEIEAYVFDELSALRAAKVRAHVAACPTCAAELSALRKERSLFATHATHAQHEIQALPSFADVLARSQGNVVLFPRSKLVAIGLSIAAAAAMIASVLVTEGDRDVASSFADSIAAEPPPEFACYEGEPISMEDSAYVLDRAIAHIEVEYGACLLATPPEGPPREVIACVLSTPVTDAPVRPQKH